MICFQCKLIYMILCAHPLYRYSLLACGIPHVRIYILKKHTHTSRFMPPSVRSRQLTRICLQSLCRASLYIHYYIKTYSLYICTASCGHLAHPVALCNVAARNVGKRCTSTPLMLVGKSARLPNYGSRLAHSYAFLYTL